MRKIISMLQPFNMKQSFYIYENGNLIAEENGSIDNNIEETIITLSEKYHANKIEIAGPKQYNRGLKRKIQEAEINKYNQNKLEINIL